MSDSSFSRNPRGDLTQGSVRQHLFRLSFPMALGITALVSFQLVDTWYIAQLGTTELAAFSFTFPVTMLVFHLILGFSIAISSVVSRLIGEGLFNDVRRVITHGMMLVAIVSTIIGLLGYAFHDAIFRAIGADASMKALISDYMVPWFLGLVLVSLPVVTNGAFRAHGDSMTPTLIMVSSAIANALIAPVMIFGYLGFPRMELAGAAYASLLANGVGAAVAIYLLWHRNGLISSEYLLKLNNFGNSCKRVLFIALPAGITSAVPAIIAGVITKYIAIVGPVSVAGFGIATRVEALILIPLMAAAGGMSPILGQNWGARKFERVSECMTDTIWFNIWWSMAMAGLLGLFAEPIASLFSSEGSVTHTAALYFWIVPISYACGNLMNGWVAAMNAIGKPIQGVLLVFAKCIILLLPAIIGGYHLGGITGLFVGIAIVNLISGLASHYYARHILHSSMAKLIDQQAR